MTDPEQLVRGLELLEVTRDDIEATRAAATWPEASRLIRELQDRVRAAAHKLARAWHPDVVGDMASLEHAEDLQAVLAAADWVRELQPRRDQGSDRRWYARVVPVEMGVRVEADERPAHWADR